MTKAFMEGESGQLVEAWIKRYELIEKQGKDSAEAKRLFWAFDELDDISKKVPEDALRLIKRILASTQNEFVLANLAAGPLETLLGKHGNTIIAEVERSANDDARFRELLRGVWQNRMDDQIWGRVLKAAKG
jgi:hypothetical protein